VVTGDTVGDDIGVVADVVTRVVGDAGAKRKRWPG
jgi:hypothetical protein